MTTNPLQRIVERMDDLVEASTSVLDSFDDDGKPTVDRDTLALRLAMLRASRDETTEVVPHSMEEMMA